MFVDILFDIYQPKTSVNANAQSVFMTEVSTTAGAMGAPTTTKKKALTSMKSGDLFTKPSNKLPALY